MIGSIVIPAHNESAVITRCLDALLAGFLPGEVDVVVSCNGCADGTAEIVRSTGHAVRVVEIEVASKAAALRAADQVLTVFPRLYLDADVILTSTAARRVLEYLSADGALAARPPIKYNTTGSTGIVRSYYRARVGVPAVMRSLWGAGVYGLSAAGRARFGPFPDVANDDLFVDQHFNRAEVVVIDAPPVIVNVPRQTVDLLRILRRIYRGNAQSRDMSAAHQTEHEVTGPSTIRGLAKLTVSKPRRALDVVTYLSLSVVARGTLVVAPSTSWERDNSSRSAF